MEKHTIIGIYLKIEWILHVIALAVMTILGIAATLLLILRQSRDRGVRSIPPWRISFWNPFGTKNR